MNILSEIQLFDDFLATKDIKEKEEIKNRWIQEFDPYSPKDIAVHRFNLFLESFRLSYDV